ncbi:peptidase inhibitor family I36 protein [Saccharopolyspora shandongensis]|uniref:peptidase inhibitor family I36 protein n=1 Tax=Saccharopolyspora shandongensis TaxID=418495 RepID=UPI003423052B
MRFTRRVGRGGIAVAAAVTLATTGAVAAPQASAAEACRPNGLCLYYNTGFNDMRFVTERTGVGCWTLLVYGLRDHVNSYRNNLPVYADFFDANGNLAWRIRPGGSSSDSRPFGGEYAVCT